MEVNKIIDDAFCEVTKKLVSLDLDRIDSDTGPGEVSSPQGYREMIQTYGYMDSMILCRFSEEMFHHIVDTMNNGVPPSEEEVPLYLNEYINIACGCAVSKINNLTGTKTRLSLPRFYRKGEPFDDVASTGTIHNLAYQSSLGMWQIYMFYSLRDCEEEN